MKLAAVPYASQQSLRLTCRWRAWWYTSRRSTGPCWTLVPAPQHCTLPWRTPYSTQQTTGSTTVSQLTARSQPRNSSTPAVALIEHRITYKLCLIMHLVHTKRAPLYLSDSVQTVGRSSSRPGLRSSNTDVYAKPGCRTRYGERGFSHAGSTACNSLPHHLHEISDTGLFKRHLKTEQFCRAYVTSSYWRSWMTHKQCYTNDYYYYYLLLSSSASERENYLHCSAIKWSAEKCLMSWRTKTHLNLEWASMMYLFMGARCALSAPNYNHHHTGDIKPSSSRCELLSSSYRRHTTVATY